VTERDVWVANRLSGTVARLDARSGRIKAKIKVGRAPSNPAVASDGTVFVPNAQSGTVSRIDPARNKVVQTIKVGGRPFPAAFAFGDIWVPDTGGTKVFRIHVG
jgi:YVTN family beta-propeller protein